MPDASHLPDPTVRNVYWRTFQFVMQSVFCFWMGYRARGLEHLPDEGALLLINHQSFLDPLLVGLPLSRPVSFLARDDLFRVPVVGHILRNTYVMPINREAASTASLREAIRRIDHGFYVGIFPEGTRTLDGLVGELKPGFLALLRRTKAPVIPVGVAGAFEAFPKGTPFPLPGRIRVVFGAPFDRDRLAASGKDEEADLLRYVRERIVACVADAQAWRDDPGTDHVAVNGDPA
ncbi:MAG TPA: lysophospholipid acyltransferase family protein [Planctomycetaceae bacterium]|nr:lysophospholipid acyltransferase family protein [Planctomycetaceae bacterium]